MSAQIIDLQRRIAEAGRIRIGTQTGTSGGRRRPVKLETFRLTSGDKLRIEQAAHLYGGDVKPWEAPAGPQWEVITKTAALDVIVPPADMAFSQAYEMWSAGGCQRRCNGRFETIGDSECVCDPDARECDIHTRLSVMLRDLPGLGVWRLDTSGFYAAVELQGAVQVIQMAASRGQMLPARLLVEQRQVKRMVNGKPQTRNFPVPRLDVEVTPGQLVAGAQHAQIEAVDEATGELRLLTPVPLALPAGPVPSVAEQAAAAVGERPRRARKGAAAPIPETGIAPRTAADAADDDPPDWATGEDPHPVVPVDDLAVELVTPAQLKALHTAFSTLGAVDRDSRLAFAVEVVGRDLESSKDLTKAEASRVLDAIKADLSEPPAEDVS